MHLPDFAAIWAEGNLFSQTAEKGDYPQLIHLFRVSLIPKTAPPPHQN